MDRRADIRDYLISRRARITPEQAGLFPSDGDVRRVPGLRREEVARRAGVSLDYYTELERGALDRASDSVLDALAHALQLDTAERAHLFDLARPAGALRMPTSSDRVRPSVQRTIDAFTGMALVRNRAWDFLAANTLGRAVYAEMFDGRIGGLPNQVRYVFLDDRSRHFFDDWDAVAHDTTRILRSEAGRDQQSPRARELVSELTEASSDFRTFWARHDVRLPASGRHIFHHPDVGPLDLIVEAASLRADPDLTLLLATPHPGSTTDTALARLAAMSASV